jgi:hypothetical protein
MTKITTKQAAAKIREHLNEAVGAAKRGGGLRFTLPDGGEYLLSVPLGLRFNVRATRGGVNVQIEDGYGPSYVNLVTDGNRRAFTRDHPGRAAIVDLVEDYERQIWGERLGKVEWGTILISATAGPSTVVTYDDEVRS